MVYIPRTVGHTIQCSAFVCSGKLSPERQRHDEENTHSLVSSCPDLINHDTSSITDASAPRCAGGQSASRRTDLAAQRAELDAGLARDRRLNRDESREKLHSIQRHSPIKAAPLALWSAAATTPLWIVHYKITQPQAIRADPQSASLPPHFKALYSSRTQRKPRLSSPLSGVAWLRAATR